VGEKGIPKGLALGQFIELSIRIEVPGSQVYHYYRDLNKKEELIEV
jgi:hypothetical protein